MTNGLRKIDIIIGSAIHILMYGIDKSEPAGKIPRKRIMRAIKTELAKTRELDPKEFINLVYASSELIEHAKNEMLFNGKLLDPIISPHELLAALRFKHPEIYSNLNISDVDLNRLNHDVKLKGLTIPSLVFLNRLYTAAGKWLTEPTKTAVAC